MILDAAGYRRGGLRVGTEDDASLFDIRAGNVDFQGRDAVYVELCSQFAVFFRRTGRDIDDERRTVTAYFRQDIPLKSVYAGIFQADAVQHACRRFGDAHARIARPRQRRNALGYNRADVVNVEEVGVFQAEAEGPRRPHDRRFHGNAGKVHSYAFLVHQKTSFAGNTGPSAQTL